VALWQPTFEGGEMGVCTACHTREAEAEDENQGTPADNSGNPVWAVCLCLTAPCMVASAAPGRPGGTGEADPCDLSRVPAVDCRREA
jgi:hypothetical protein